MASTRRTSQKGKANLANAIKPKQQKQMVLDIPKREPLTKEDKDKMIEALKEPGSITPFEAINRLVVDDVIKLNHNGKDLYEVTGITKSEYDSYLIALILALKGQTQKKSEKVETLANKCLKDKKLLTIILWNLTK